MFKASDSPSSHGFWNEGSSYDQGICDPYWRITTPAATFSYFRLGSRIQVVDRGKLSLLVTSNRNTTILTAVVLFRSCLRGVHYRSVVAHLSWNHGSAQGLDNIFISWIRA